MPGVNHPRRHQEGKRTTAFRPPKADPHPVGAHTIEDLAREVLDLRAQVNELRASHLPPRFKSINWDNTLGTGSKYEECGFRPYCAWFWGNNTSGGTLTFTTGFWVYDDDLDEGFLQACTGIRRSNLGEWRNSSGTFFMGMLNDEDSTFDNSYTLNSIDSNGFTFTVATSAVPAIRGFVIGR